MEYIQRLIKPFNDRTNHTSQVVQPLKRKEDPPMSTFDPQYVGLYLSQIHQALQTQQHKYAIYQSSLLIGNLGEYECRIESGFDHLFKMCTSFHSHRRTLHQAVYLMDTLLSNVKYDVNEISRVINACYFIASKYEEIYPAPIWKYVNDKHEITEIVNIENRILQIIDFRLITASPYVWVNFYWTIIEIQEKSNEWLKYCRLMIDVALYSVHCLKFESSKIAAAAIYTSMTMLNIKLNWNSIAQQFQVHFMHEIKEVVNIINITLKESILHKREMCKHIQYEKDTKCYKL